MSGLSCLSLQAPVEVRVTFTGYKLHLSGYKIYTAVLESDSQPDQEVAERVTSKCREILSERSSAEGYQLISGLIEKHHNHLEPFLADLENLNSAQMDEESKQAKPKSFQFILMRKGKE